MKPIIFQIFLSACALVAAFYFWPNPYAQLVLGLSAGVCATFAFVMFDLRDTAFIDMRRR